LKSLEQTIDITHSRQIYNNPSTSALAQIRILKDITISYYLILPLDLGSGTVMSTRGKDRFALVSPIACVIVDSVFVHIFL
jgi:hypothetical protein